MLGAALPCRYSWRQQAPQLALTLLLAAELWTLILSRLE